MIRQAGWTLEADRRSTAAVDDRALEIAGSSRIRTEEGSRIINPGLATGRTAAWVEQATKDLESYVNARILPVKQDRSCEP